MCVGQTAPRLVILENTQPFPRCSGVECWTCPQDQLEEPLLEPVWEERLALGGPRKKGESLVWQSEGRRRQGQSLGRGKRKED